MSLVCIFSVDRITCLRINNFAYLICYLFIKQFISEFRWSLFYVFIADMTPNQTNDPIYLSIYSFICGFWCVMTYIIIADSTFNHITYFFIYLRIISTMVCVSLQQISYLLHYTSHLFKYIFIDGSFNQSVAKTMNFK